MNILIAVIIFSLLVLVHEFGHFIVAKKAGIGVTEFAIGMGPRLIHWGKGETVYCIKLIPFGGSCMMVGEDEDDPADNAFNRKPVWARMAVVAAGPVFNLLFALVVSVFLVWQGGVNLPMVYQVMGSSGAEEAGIQDGDIITAINGRKIELGREIEIYLFDHPLDGSDITVSFIRNGEEQKVVYTPKAAFWRMGISYYSDASEPVLSAVDSSGPAAEAGMQAGDRLVSINDMVINQGKDIETYFDEHPADGSPFTVVYERDGQQQEAEITPVWYETDTLGFSAAYLYNDVQGIGECIRYAFSEVHYWLSYTIMSLRMMITGRVGLQDMSGPVGIVDTIGTAVDTGMENGGVKLAALNVMTMVVLLNVNLGVLNLLPLPALDGGRLLFMIIEVIRRKPVPADKEGMVHTIGFGLLMALMAVIFFNDIMKLFA